MIGQSVHIAILVVSAWASAEVDQNVRFLGKERPKAIQIEAITRIQKLAKLPASESALPALQGCLRDSDSDVRSNAAHAVGAIAFLRGLPCPRSLVTAMLDPNHDVRASAYTYVPIFRKFELGCDAVLLDALGGTHLDVRQCALIALAHVENAKEKHLDVITKLTEDRDAGVRNNAHAMLYKLAGDRAKFFRHFVRVWADHPSKEGPADETDKDRMDRISNYLFAQSAVDITRRWARDEPAELTKVVFEALDAAEWKSRSDVLGFLLGALAVDDDPNQDPDPRWAGPGPHLRRWLSLPGVARRLKHLSEYDKEPRVRATADVLLDRAGLKQ